MFIHLQIDALVLIMRVLRPPQATSCTALEMPTSSEILQVILEYIYTDESPTIKGNFSNNVITPKNALVNGIAAQTVKRHRVTYCSLLHRVSKR